MSEEALMNILTVLMDIKTLLETNEKRIQLHERAVLDRISFDAAVRRTGYEARTQLEQERREASK